MIIATPIPHDEASASLRAKPALTRGVFDALEAHLQARAFTISGVECLDTLANVRDIIARLPQGADWDDTKAAILAKISPWFIDPAADPDEQKKQTNAARRRAEMLLRMHGWQAYAQTQYELMEAHSDVFPFRQYLSSDDGRVRPTHAALHKKILPADHPFWKSHTPPWEFNCRCDCVPMTRDDVDEIQAKEKNLPPEDQKVLPPAQLREIEQYQRMVKPGGQGYLDTRTPREKNGGNSGYEYRPDINAMPIAQIIDRFSPAEKSLFYTWAQTVKLPGGKTLSDWWSVAPPVAPTLPSVASRRVGADLRKSLLAQIEPDYKIQVAAIEAKRLAKTNAYDVVSKSYSDKDWLAYEQAMKDMQKEIRNLEPILERARGLAEIPSAERGQVTFISQTAMNTAPNITEGTAITTRYTHKDLLPQIAIAKHKGRAHYDPAKKAIHVDLTTSASTVAHETTHGTEIQNPEILKSARAFLLYRSGGKKPVKLSKLTGNKNYKKHEVAYEDEWVTKGGSHYTGKDYEDYATEILTMGIERLHRDPFLFAETDPEYFDFVIETLQNTP